MARDLGVDKVCLDLLLSTARPLPAASHVESFSYFVAPALAREGLVVVAISIAPCPNFFCLFGKPIERSPDDRPDSSARGREDVPLSGNSRIA
jgi:hypothetical protein